MPRGTWLFRGTQDIYLKILEPVSVEGWNTKLSGELRELVRERMIAELHRMRATIPRHSSDAKPVPVS